MKKVRYAIGALGMAPAIGLLLPTVNATASTTHTPKKMGKTVSLAHSKMGRVDTCGHNEHKHTSKGLFEGSILFSGTCVHQVTGILHKEQNSLSMRTRLYNAAGTRIFQNFVSGAQGGGETVFVTFPNVGGVNEACEALVATGNHNDVKYGPTCQFT